MQFKFFVVFATFFIADNCDAIIRKGECCPQKSLEGSLATFNGKLWYEFAATDAPSNQKCPKNIFDTNLNGNGTTYITRTFVDTSSELPVVITGTLMYDSNCGPSSLQVPGFPTNSSFYLLDLKKDAATFYLCYDLGNGYSNEMGFVFVADLPHQCAKTVKKILKRSEKVLKPLLGSHICQLEENDQSCAYNPS